MGGALLGGLLGGAGGSLLGGSNNRNNRGSLFGSNTSSNNRPGPQKVGSEDTGANVNDGWHNMRILVDFKHAKQFLQQNPSLQPKYEMSVRLVQSTKLYFEQALQVNYPNLMNFAGGTCYKLPVPAFSRRADLYIVIKPESDSTTSYFAAATSCYLSQRDGRPIIGAYILNYHFLKTAKINEYLYFSTFAHEFTHILGFSDNLFDRFVRNGSKIPKSEVTGVITIGSESFTAIILPEVVNYARTYFNCPNIQGVPLENGGGEGSAGSHWEKLFLPSEYMNPSVENPGILSAFTFAFLKGTGWYQPNAGMEQPYDWAKGVGCRHFEICPKDSHGYCTAAESGNEMCSTEYTSKAICRQDKLFSSGCYVKRSQEHTCTISGASTAFHNEELGPGSRCFNWFVEGTGVGGGMRIMPRCSFAKVNPISFSALALESRSSTKIRHFNARAQDSTLKYKKTR